MIILPKNFCPECKKESYRLNLCRICDENRFCSHCHSERKRDVDRVGFNADIDVAQLDKHGNFPITKSPYKLKKKNNRPGVKRDIQSLYGCLSCMIQEFQQRQKSAQEHREKYPPLRSFTDQNVYYEDHPRDLQALVDIWVGRNKTQNEIVSEIPISEDYNLGIIEFIDKNIGCELIIEYTNADGIESKRRIVPIDLGEYSNGSVFLNAFCHSKQDERHFRIDRIKTIETND